MPGPEALERRGALDFGDRVNCGSGGRVSADSAVFVEKDMAPVVSYAE